MTSVSASRAVHGPVTGRAHATIPTVLVLLVLCASHLAVSGVPDRDQGLAGALLIPLRTPTAHNTPARSR
ncbi:hypothetical protein [Streptomyces sp. NPDC058086]|uniref:hypothetical protein n=1 Tax=Streptomyces sp. NPDC058086 TaxID=3346334 RepID=UPI0036E7A9D2